VERHFAVLQKNKIKKKKPKKTLHCKRETSLIHFEYLKSHAHWAAFEKFTKSL